MDSGTTSPYVVLRVRCAVCLRAERAEEGRSGAHAGAQDHGGVARGAGRQFPSPSHRSTHMTRAAFAPPCPPGKRRSSPRRRRKGREAAAGGRRARVILPRMPPATPRLHTHKQEEGRGPRTVSANQAAVASGEDIVAVGGLFLPVFFSVSQTPHPLSSCLPLAPCPCGALAPSLVNSVMLI